MNLHTVAYNLRKTIVGKEMLLDIYNNPSADTYQKSVKEVMVQGLEANIDELKCVLVDVEACVAKDAEDSWKGDVDRQGGSFTAEELDPNRGWI